MSLLLSAANLAFAYDRTPVLREISLALAAGELVALLGPNGAGKSTLIKSLLGILHAQGVITWDDRPIRQWRRRDLAKYVAYLPQSPSYEPGQSVADVLRLGRAPYWAAFGVESERDVRVVDQIARQLELSDLLKRPMAQLSGGQRQRVFIGRCLVQEPKALLLDEPNTHLDLKHHVELCSLLGRLARQQNLGVLMASHDINLASMFASRVVLMQDGQVLLEGSPADVLASPKLDQAYGLPIQRLTTPQRQIVIIPSI